MQWWANKISTATRRKLPKELASFSSFNKNCMVRLVAFVRLS